MTPEPSRSSTPSKSPTSSPDPSVSPDVDTPLPHTPSATATVTVTPASKPDDVPLTDHLQGWGTVLAAFVALGVAVYGWRRESRQRQDDQREAKEQQEQADAERAHDRAMADRRLHDERRAADARLEAQFADQRRRDRRDFLIRQIQRAGDLYAEHEGMKRDKITERMIVPDNPDRKYAQQVAAQRLRASLPALPAPYASLLKVQVFGDSSPLIDEATLAEATRRVPDPSGVGVGDYGGEEIYQELADNIAKLLK